MKVNFWTMLLAGSAPALLLGGCSGDNTHQFVSFATLVKPGTTQIPAMTTEASHSSAAPAQHVNTLSPTTNGSGTVTLTVDASGSVTALTINGTQSSVSFAN